MTTNIFAGRADILAAAIHSEPHAAVRQVLDLNAWKIKTWQDYAAWKRHGQNWVAINWRAKCRQAISFDQLS